MSEVQGPYELPNSWAWTKLGNIQLNKSRSITPSNEPDEIFELYSVPAFETDNPEIVSGNEIGSNKQVVEEETVLLCKINPRINRVWIVGNRSPYLKIASTEWIPFYKLREIDPKYLCYYMRNDSFRDFLATNASGVGGSLMRIKPATFSDYQFPLPPLSEQRRIVAEIEELFTQLDAGVSALEKSRAQLKRYRQSALKAAVEGKLTEEWRRGHPDVEPASVLLERIEGEREKSGDGRRKNLRPLDTAGLPELPVGWQWIALDSILSRIEAGKSFKCEERPPSADEIGVLKVSAVTWGEFKELESKTCTNPERVDPRFFVMDNDFLFSRANTIELVGACVIVKRIFGRLMLSDKILRFRFIETLPSWVLFVLRSRHGRDEIERLATGNQYSMRNISQNNIRSISIPLPPLAEQHKIVSEIEQRLSVADNTEAALEANLKRAARLRQSILKKAFRGKLVPQDPNDEPASVLLDKIRMERANHRPKEKNLGRHKNNPIQMELN